MNKKILCFIVIISIPCIIIANFDVSFQSNGKKIISNLTFSNNFFYLNLDIERNNKKFVSLNMPLAFYFKPKNIFLGYFLPSGLFEFAISPKLIYEGFPLNKKRLCNSNQKNVPLSIGYYSPIFDISSFISKKGKGIIINKIFENFWISSLCEICKKDVDSIDSFFLSDGKDFPFSNYSNFMFCFGIQNLKKRKKCEIHSFTSIHFFYNIIQNQKIILCNTLNIFSIPINLSISTLIGSKTFDCKNCNSQLKILYSSKKEKIKISYLKKNYPKMIFGGTAQKKEILYYTKIKMPLFSIKTTNCTTYKPTREKNSYSLFDLIFKIKNTKIVIETKFIRQKNRKDSFCFPCLRVENKFLKLSLNNKKINYTFTFSCKMDKIKIHLAFNQNRWISFSFSLSN